MKIRRVLLLVARSCLGAPAAAQVRITGAINGTVTDASDAVVPGALVQLKDEGHRRSRRIPSPTCPGFRVPRSQYRAPTRSPCRSRDSRRRVYNKVIVESGRTTDLRVKLAPGVSKRP